jgi:CubicO group peptidase (beta-lactamase class C family)
MGNEQQDIWESLQALVSGEMKKTGVPGVAVGILHDDEIRAAGFGVTNVDHPLDVTDHTLFQIGSITKTFTGTVIMRLAEMGKIDLDATVRTYVPEFKVGDETTSSQATIRHLLIHTGGWVGDFFRDTGPGADALPEYVAAMADLEQLAPLGTVWSYNNSGFYLAGYVIERVTGQSYEAALHDLVLEPLGLKSTFLNPADVMVHRFAAGHNIGETGAQVAQPWSLPRAAWPAGGITCTMHDLLRYAGFHMGDGTLEDGTQLLRPESLSQMQTPQATDKVDATRLVGHGGGTTGQVSLLTLVPEHKFAVAIFTNANSGGFVTGDVTKWALKGYLGLEKPDPKPIQASEEELGAFVGRYERPMVDLELGLLCGRLVGQMVYKQGFPSQDSPPPPPPPPATLALCETDRLIVLDGMMKDGTVDVIRKGDGSIGWLRAGGRILKRLR